MSMNNIDLIIVFRDCNDHYITGRLAYLEKFIW